MDTANHNPARGVLIWDLPTRLFHWALVLAVAGAFLSQWFYEHIPFWIHRACGIAALVLVLFRILWGFAGTRHARFADFVSTPRSTWQYLKAVCRRQSAPVAGHTPTGGWMILILLGLIAVQAGLGLYANDETDSAGPLVGWVSHAVSNRMTGWHHRIGTALWVAIAIHVLAVAFYQLVLREDLVRSLWNGRRNGIPVSEGISGHQWGRAALILLLCAGAIAAIIEWAPPIPDMLM
jgi:cytochrome b